ncbi:Do family serine endopeptidase [Polycladidibacter stylochi]|uniref:Do family serine endopeptidase n=1 Tax=Polycladidibacter stylochi TaxID=1807766 RepID=UPI0008335908|nr:Do family serine endopeptidase [Pseudovibrio stylochi]
MRFIRKGSSARMHALASLLTILMLCLGGFALSVDAQAQGPVSVADLADELADTVVNISTAQKVVSRKSPGLPEIPEGSPFQEFFEDYYNDDIPGEGPRKVQSLGSGFVIDGKQGIIVTNNHVIEGSDAITVNFNDGSKLQAKVLGVDEKTDLAVLKVEPKAPLKEAGFGNSQKLRVGDWVMAIGNPFGLGGTVTVGIVSARNRNINAGPYDNFIQTDASINRGNSGGPLFNMDGEVVGINTAIFSPSGGSIGIGFAIPADTATKIITQLREYGEARRGWIGVRIQEVSEEIAESLGLDRARGALVANVSAEGPAKAAGIMPGDVILRFDTTEIKSMRDLPRRVAETAIGTTVKVLVFRRGKKVELETKVERLQEADEKSTIKQDDGLVSENTDHILGMKLLAVDNESRKQFGVSSEVEGVIVTSVVSGSVADDKGIRRGDVIVEIAQEPVFSSEDVVQSIQQLKNNGRRSALLLVSSGAGDLRFVALRLE